MARGRKKRENITLEEQLKIVEEQMAILEEQIKDLKEKKKEISQKIKEEEKEKLYNAVVQSGKTIEEVLAVISVKEEKK